MNYCFYWEFKIKFIYEYILYKYWIYSLGINMILFEINHINN